MAKWVTLLLCGKMRSGKDESCNILLDSLLPKDLLFKRESMAWEVKVKAAKILSELWGSPVTPQMFDDPILKPKLRKYVIFAGELGRLLDQDVWVNLLSPKLSESNSIVTDIRFEHELRRLIRNTTEAHKVLAVKLISEESLRIKRGAQPEFFSNPSEIGLDNISDSEYNLIVSNNGNLKDLSTQLNPIVEQIKKHLYET